MKNNLLNSLAMGTAVVMLASASITDTFGDDHRNGGHDQRKNNGSSQRVYTYSPKDNRHDHHENHEQKIQHRGREYIYRDNHFYNRDRGGKLVITTAPIGAVVLSLPRIFSTVTFGNASIFFNGGIYYKRCNNGYVVVDRPHFHRPPEYARRVVVREREYYVHNNIYYCKDGNDYTVCEPPEQVIVQNTSSDITIMVENSNGSRTPVTLSPIGGNQWKGPRGEIYNGIPDGKQLVSAYGF
jgi:hypothetical protein